MKEINKYVDMNIMKEGTCGETVFVIGNGYDDSSSNPGKDRNLTALPLSQCK